MSSRLSTHQFEGQTGSTKTAERDGMDRMQFIRGIVLTIWGANCLLAKTPEFLAQKPGTLKSRPSFTENSINSLSNSLTHGPETEETRRLIAAARKDWRTFVKSQFRLTPGQTQALNSLSPELVRKIQQTVNRALGSRSQLTVQATAAQAQPPGAVATVKWEAKIEVAQTVGPDNKDQTQIKVSGGVSC